MSSESGAIRRLGWYARRLRSMDKGEIVWRASQVAQRFTPAPDSPEAVAVLTEGLSWDVALERFRSAKGRPVLLDRTRAETIAVQDPERVAELIRVADQLAAGSFAFFGYPAVTLRQPIDWHHDPFADLRWPGTPSHRLDHRVAAGDAKWIWELNRLQHLPLLAEAWLFTGENCYSATAFGHLDSWIDQNPFGRGIAWRGAFEAGMRAVSIAIALQGLRDAPELTPERYRRIVGVLAESARRCWRERSLFSSANNHLIGEMTGLAVVAMLIPELRSADKWERNAVATLIREAPMQVLADGCGAEQAIGYQMAAVEQLHLVAALLRERNGYAPAPIADAIRRSSVFLSAVVGTGDPDPSYGDYDQEFAVRLGPEAVRNVRDHLGVVAASGFGYVGPLVGSETLSAQWFRAASGAEPHAPVADASSGADRSFYAPDGGLAVLRSGRRRVIMDVGSLGHLSIAAHGHADALAVTVSDDGHDIIGDPGTGSYYQHPDWRDMMRGTRAHGTVCVDGADQSVIGGPFLWSEHAAVRLRGIDVSAGLVDAEHDGYTRLPGHVMHRRWLIAPPAERCIAIVDLVTGDGNHEVRTTWPLHPSVQVQRIPEGHLLTRDDAVVGQILHSATGPLAIDDAFGDESQVTGWWSERLESRVPTWWLGAVCRSELPVVMATLIWVGDGPPASDLSVDNAGNRITLNWWDDGRERSLEVQIDAPAAVNWRS